MDTSYPKIIIREFIHSSCHFSVFSVYSRTRKSAQSQHKGVPYDLSVKQMEAYKRNFGKGNSIELKLRELDIRMRHLQSLELRVVRGDGFNNII